MADKWATWAAQQDTKQKKEQQRRNQGIAACGYIRLQIQRLD